MTDNELLESIYSDEASGVAALVDTYAELLYGVAYNVLRGVGSEKDVEDCITDSFVAFYNNIDDVDISRAGIKGYLGVIVRRRAVDLRCTLNSDGETAFPDLTVEKMYEILGNIEPDKDEEFAERIKAQVLREIYPEEFTQQVQESQDIEYEEEEESPQNYQSAEEYTREPESEPVNTNGPVVIEESGTRIHPIFKVMFMAVALVLAVAVGLIAFNELSVPKYEDTTTTTETTQVSGIQAFNPLKDAISVGDEQLIESLITNSLLLSKDIITFAVEYAQELSYTAIKSIAEATKASFGTTGLDPLLENAILGNTQGVIDELSGKRMFFKTYGQKLAFFFTAAFGESEAIKAFLDKGFELTMKDAAGKTAYEIAEQYGNTENVKEAERLAQAS
ncbi:MAG: hypothetical protein J6V06_05285 [Clostridia bacterium]|nr:hypothetical protein [Clostridia bacterium]